MSRARAEKDRLPLDAYQTPGPLALAICAELRRQGENPIEIIEPGAGEGAFIVAARATWPDARIIAVELYVNAARRRALFAAGADQVIGGRCWTKVAADLANAGEREPGGPRRLILGNPSFRSAQPHIEHGLDALIDGERLAFLLRVNFLGCTDRVRFWRRPGLLELKTIAPRPSFFGGGSDGTEYAIFSWRKGYRGAALVARPLVWTPERKRRAA